MTHQCAKMISPSAHRCTVAPRASRQGVCGGGGDGTLPVSSPPSSLGAQCLMSPAPRRAGTFSGSQRCVLGSSNSARCSQQAVWESLGNGSLRVWALLAPSTRNSLSLLNCLAPWVLWGCPAATPVSTQHPCVDRCAAPTRGVQSAKPRAEEILSTEHVAVVLDEEKGQRGKRHSEAVTG